MSLLKEKSKYAGSQVTPIGLDGLLTHPQVVDAV